MKSQQHAIEALDVYNINIYYCGILVKLRFDRKKSCVVQQPQRKRGFHKDAENLFSVSFGDRTSVREWSTC
jgi:hypothetical protein